MDDADITAERAEYDHLANLERSRRPTGPQPTGHCLTCGAPLLPGYRWCDAQCRDDWEQDNGAVR